MKWIKRLFVLLVGLIAVLVGLGFALSTEYMVETSVTIDASPAQIHALVANLERWPEWSPWDKTDPTINTTLGGVTKGEGANQTWTSDSGNGELTITRSDPMTGIEYEMAFVDGERRMPATSQMVYRPEDGKTKVIWAMQGDFGSMPVIGAYFAALMPYMTGPMFDMGLADLKALAEAEPMPEPAPATQPAEAAAAAQ